MDRGFLVLVDATTPRHLGDGGMIARTLVLVMALCTSAQAHEWYPLSCCSDRDCWPMGAAADAREPDPTFTPAGWRLHDGIVVPFAATRASPDGRFHVCRMGGAPRGSVVSPSGQAPCLFAPPQGS